MKPPMLYVSGQSSLHDFLGVASADVPIGLQVNLISSNVERQMIEYNMRGGEMFVDSGAFTAFRKEQNINFDHVLARYLSLADQMRFPSKLAVVAPDKIGDMVETVRLQKEHLQQLIELKRLGTTLLIPVQKGMPLNQVKKHHDYLQRFLDDYVVALPCNTKAMTPDDAVEIVKVLNPSRIHLLGVGRRNLKLFYNVILAQKPDIILTADANRVRAFLGKGRDITEKVKNGLLILHDQMLEGAVLHLLKRKGFSLADSQQIIDLFLGDETEVLCDLMNSPGFITPDQAEILGRFFGISDRSALNRWRQWSQEESDVPFGDEDMGGVYGFDSDDEVGCKLGVLLGQYGFSRSYFLFSAILPHAAEDAITQSRKQSPKIRQNSIADVISKDFQSFADNFNDTDGHLRAA